MLYTEKATLNTTPFCKSLAEWQQKNNNSYEMSSVDMKPPQKMRVSLHFGAPKLSQSVAEQARLARARLFANRNKVRTVYWIYLGGFIYVLVCLNECLRSSINSSKQTYLQTEEQPPLCAGFGFLETRMEKIKRGRKSIIYRLIRYKSGITQHAQTLKIISSHRTSLQPHPDTHDIIKCPQYNQPMDAHRQPCH